MEEIVLQNEIENINPEDVLHLTNIDLDKIKVTKKATGIFEVTYHEKLFRTEIKATTGTINRGVCRDKFFSPYDFGTNHVLWEIFTKIRHKINQMNDTSNIFVTSFKLQQNCSKGKTIAENNKVFLRCNCVL